MIKPKYLQELNCDDMGVSSTTMLFAFLDIENNSRWGNGTPCDPSDFGRCHRLLERNPEFRNKLSKLNKFKKWIPLVDSWDEMTKLYLEEYPTGTAPKLYKLMKDLGC